MAKFTTRVELHNASGDNYDTLYEEMENQGFAKTITDRESGQVYDLPEAEYNLIGDFTKKQVLDKAKSAAELTGCEYSILVTKSAGRTWSGLDKD